MTKTKGLILGCALAIALTSGAAYATYHGSRQYYGGWNKHSHHSYSYRTYYYKPTPTYSGYKHHYVVHYPSKPKYYYYYNPYKKTYWGRCPVEQKGDSANYQILDEKDRKGTLKEIPEDKFQKAGPMPPIPDSDPKEKTQIDLPPDEPPGDENKGLPTSEKDKE